MISSLRLIKNNRAVMKIARITDGALWPRNLPPPVMVADTEVIARAKSLVVSERGHVDLTADEAKAIVAEYAARG